MPFLDAGYGVNVDGWRVARVARDLAMTGQYSVSRFPGYPIQEITCSFFWRGGPWALNGLSAFLSAVATCAFAAIVRKLGCREWFLASLALAATPIFFVSSACSKDYIWGLAFVLLSFLYALNKRPAMAGLFLGIATGCRITSLAMLLPIGLLIFLPGLRWRDLIKFVGIATIVALLAFLPVWSRYGPGFFTFYHSHARPRWPTICSRGTFEVWGSVGLIAVGVAAIGTSFARQKSWLTNIPVVVSLLLMIAIYIAAYLRLPDQAGYLLPIVPSVLLLICLFANKRLLQFVLCCLLFAPLIDVTPSGARPGPILVDHAERIQNLIEICNFLKMTERVPGKNVFVVGASEPEIDVLTPHFRDGRIRYVYVMNADEAEAAVHNGWSLYCLPVIRAFNYRVNGVDLAGYGAMDLRTLWQTSPTLSAGQP